MIYPSIYKGMAAVDVTVMNDTFTISLPRSLSKKKKSIRMYRAVSNKRVNYIPLTYFADCAFAPIIERHGISPTLLMEHY